MRCQAGAMTQQGSPTGQAPRRDGFDQLFGTVRGLGVRRDPSTRWFSGVCSGLALRLGVDPLIIRAGFILGTCMFGIAVPLYLAAWALLPDGDDHILFERAVREGHGSSVTACVVLGILLLNSIWVFWAWGSWGFGIGPVVVAGLIIWAIASGRVGRKDFEDPGDVARRVRESVERNDWVDRMRQGWRAGATPGNRAAQAGADQRSGIDLRKDAGPGTTSGTPPRAPGRPWTPPRPTPPERPRRRAFGVFALMVLGLAAIAGAATAMALDGTAYADDALQVGLAAATAVVGIALVVGGLLGARGGVLHAVGVPLAIVTAISLVVPTGLPWSGGVGTRTWEPVAVSADGRHDFSLVTGDGTLDLTRAVPTGTAASDRPVTLTTRVNVGTLIIEVPADLTVRFHTKVDVGGMTLPSSVYRQTGDGSAPSGMGVERDFTVGSGAPDVTVDARVGIGNLTIERQ